MKLGLGSVRRIMIEEGIWKAKKARKVEVHQMRERRASNGELEQMDGTDHDWFEGRWERCTLLVMIDDATGSWERCRLCRRRVSSATAGC